MTSLRNFLLLITVICTLSFTISNKVNETIEKSNVAVGKLAPEFSFKNNKNELVNLKKLKGKYIYINLWTTWSEPSKEELPYLQELIEDHQDNITFVNISVDYSRDIKKWKKAIEENNLKGIQLITDKNWQSEFIKAFNIVKIPRAILIDKEGKIVLTDAPKPSNPKIKELFNSLEI